MKPSSKRIRYGLHCCLSQQDHYISELNSGLRGEHGHCNITKVRKNELYGKMAIMHRYITLYNTPNLSDANRLKVEIEGDEFKYKYRFFDDFLITWC